MKTMTIVGPFSSFQMRSPPGSFARDAAADATDNRVLEGMLLKIDAERKTFLGIAMLPNMHAQHGETGI
jgi:hypothetical protein